MIRFSMYEKMVSENADMLKKLELYPGNGGRFAKMRIVEKKSYEEIARATGVVAERVRQSISRVTQVIIKEWREEVQS